MDKVVGVAFRKKVSLNGWPMEASRKLRLASPELVCNGEPSAGCCHVFAADLQVETVRISDMEAIVGVRSRVQAPALQFCLDRAFIPCGDRVRDVVDTRWRNLRGSVSRNNESVAVIEHEAALFPGVRDHFQAEEVSVKIAGLGVVGDLVRDVIHCHRTKSLALVPRECHRARRTRRCRSQHQALNELSASYFAVFEIFQQAGNEVLHGVAPFRSISIRQRKDSW